MQGGCSFIVLAAGKGTRMKTSLPKVLHKICGKPMIEYVIDTLKEYKEGDINVVVGYAAQQVQDYLSQRYENIKFVLQEPQLGTADAVKKVIEKHELNKEVVILSGDVPLLEFRTLEKLIEVHRENNAAITLITTLLEDPTGYGRIIRKNGEICGIVEEKDATPQQREIKEINAGIYCIDRDFLNENIGKIKNDNKKGEYYLTDIVELAILSNKKVVGLCVEKEQTLGVNNLYQLAKVSEIVKERILRFHMENGVIIVDPSTTYIEYEVEIGHDTIIYPFTVICSGVKIGCFCEVGPFTHLRKGAILSEYAEIGNFTEVKNSFIGSYSKAKHLSYIGDAHIGEKVNIGAGTITANYDGKQKHRTIVNDGAFIGSGSILIAPVSIGKNAITGAGSVVTKGHDVPDNSIVVGVPAKLFRRKDG